MSNENMQEQPKSLWASMSSWLSDSWKKNKVAYVGTVGAAIIIGSLTLTNLFSDNAETEGVTGDQTIEQITDTVADTAKIDLGNDAAIIKADTTETVDVEPEPEVDTIIDSPEEVLDLLSDLGLSDIFADEVERLSSDNVNVASQATKDIGHMLANGIDVQEDDALANTFFQASYDMDGNTQAAHSIGYQALHGIGMDGADLDLAEDMLNEANDNGHKLAAAHLDYLYQIK